MLSPIIIMTRLFSYLNKIAAKPKPFLFSSTSSKAQFLSSSSIVNHQLQSSTFSRPLSNTFKSKMSFEYHQAAHPLTMIPGPIEFSDKVLAAMATPSQAHTSPQFISTFQQVLKKLRKVFISTDSNAQPYVIAGSGTLGWDIVASNLINKGDKALLLSSGFFGDSFADCLSTYGADVKILSAPCGDAVDLKQVEAELKANKYAIITVTHVDTSTAVVSDIKSLSEIVHKVSPETLIIVDGVCSVGVEEIRFDEWGLDFVLTASQKALSCPAGLSVSFASERAVKFALNRKENSTFFASLKRWTPIMNAYESGNGAYFATPAVQTITALNASLDEVLENGIEARFKKHAEVSKNFKNQLKNDLGLKLVSNTPEVSANGLTAVYLPDGISNADLLPLIAKKGVVLAGGLYKGRATSYFRIGHMGVSVVQEGRNDADIVFSAIKSSLEELGYKK